MAKTKNLAEVIKRRLAKDADLAAAVENECFNAHIAEQIYNARVAADVSQTKLAEAIGSHQSVISRLEDADYDSHSLSMLRKIANALNMNLRVEFYSPCKLKSVYHDVIEADAPVWNKKGAAWQSKVSVSRPTVRVG